MQSASGCRRWLRIFRETSAGHFVFRAKLLRRIRQRRRNDERR